MCSCGSTHFVFPHASCMSLLFLVGSRSHMWILLPTWNHLLNIPPLTVACFWLPSVLWQRLSSIRSLTGRYRLVSVGKMKESQFIWIWGSFSVKQCWFFVPFHNAALNLTFTAVLFCSWWDHSTVEGFLVLSIHLSIVLKTLNTLKVFLVKCCLAVCFVLQSKQIPEANTT